MIIPGKTLPIIYGPPILPHSMLLTVFLKTCMHFVEEMSVCAKAVHIRNKLETQILDVNKCYGQICKVFLLFLRPRLMQVLD